MVMLIFFLPGRCFQGDASQQKPLLDNGIGRVGNGTVRKGNSVETAPIPFDRLHSALRSVEEQTGGRTQMYICRCMNPVYI